MDIAISGGTVIDVEGGEAIPDGVVLIRNGKVAEVGARGYVGIPDGAEVIELAGGWVLPGLVNLHGHFTLDAGPAPVESLDLEPMVLTAMRATGHAAEALSAGVTSVRELGARAGMSIELRDAIARGYVQGPRIFAAGLGLTWTGGTGQEVGREADGPDELRKAVREQVKHGADVIKIFASGGISSSRDRPAAKGLSVPEMRAAIDEAHRAGLKTTAHASTTDGIQDAVEAGIDCVEHGIGLDEETARVMAERRTPLVSTLAVHQVLLFRTPPGDPKIDAYKARAKGRPQRRKESFQRALAAGVPIGAGSDAGTVLNGHGDFVTELEQMVDAGVSCIDAVRAATVWASQIIGSASIGTLKPGVFGDVVVCQRDPRNDVSALRELLMVVKGGVIAVDRRPQHGVQLPNPSPAEVAASVGGR